MDKQNTKDQFNRISVLHPKETILASDNRQNESYEDIFNDNDHSIINASSWSSGELNQFSQFSLETSEDSLNTRDVSQCTIQRSSSMIETIEQRFSKLEIMLSEISNIEMKALQQAIHQLKLQLSSAQTELSDIRAQMKKRNNQKEIKVSCKVLYDIFCENWNVNSKNCLRQFLKKHCFQNLLSIRQLQLAFEWVDQMRNNLTFKIFNEEEFHYLYLLSLYKQGSEPLQLKQKKQKIEKFYDSQITADAFQLLRNKFTVPLMSNSDYSQKFAQEINISISEFWKAVTNTDLYFNYLDEKTLRYLILSCKNSEYFLCLKNHRALQIFSLFAFYHTDFSLKEKEFVLKSFNEYIREPSLEVLILLEVERILEIKKNLQRKQY